MYRAHRRFIGLGGCSYYPHYYSYVLSALGGFSSIRIILLKVIIGPLLTFQYPDKMHHCIPTSIILRYPGEGESDVALRSPFLDALPSRLEPSGPHLDCALLS
jgi:hypothetical protein